MATTKQPWETQRGDIGPSISADSGKVRPVSLLLIAVVAFFLGSYFPWQPVNVSRWINRGEQSQTAELARGTWVLLVEESAERTNNPWFVSILSDRDYWNSLSASGIIWRLYDIDSPALEPYRADAKGAGLPALLVVSPVGKVKLAKACPHSTELIAAELRGLR